MKSSMRLSSSAENSAMSWKLATCRSGMTSRCVGACGLMSRMATKPSTAATWSPSRYSLQKRQSSGSADPLLRHRFAADADELADGRVDEPRRVVVAVPAAGAIDEDEVVAPDLRPPPRAARVVRELTQARASLPLDRRRDGVVVLGVGARPRRVREDVQFRHSGVARDAERAREGAFVLGGKAHDDVARQVELVL